MTMQKLVYDEKNEPNLLGNIIMEYLIEKFEFHTLDNSTFPVTVTEHKLLYDELHQLYNSNI
jgi:hypothetical protein